MAQVHQIHSLRRIKNEKIIGLLIEIMDNFLTVIETKP